MYNFISTLLADVNDNVSDFWTSFLPVFRYVLFGIVIACAIVMIITTLMQANDSSQSLDAFTGGGKQESYYAQNKGASRDSILKKITISMAIIIFVCMLLFFISLLIAGERL